MGRTKAFIKTPETLFALEAMRDRYWHNMAIRIQRAWRNYVRYRTECAIRIQRFWRRINGGLEYIKLRDQGHKVLAGRKERRRFSLVGSRRFLGDYIGVANKGGPGEVIRTAINLSPSEPILFSCRAEILVSKLGRSSKPEPRTLILTPRSVYIVKQVLVQREIEIQTERSIGLGSIKRIGCSNLKDDWFAIVVGAPQEPDPLLSCILKTEFFTHLENAVRGTIELRIGSTIEYNKKPNKPFVIKTIKDAKLPQNPPGEVIYKSSTIHANEGMPPNSVSKPTPRPRPVAGRPITSGKLLRPGGPGGGPSKLASRPAAQARPGRSNPQASVNGSQGPGGPAMRAPPPPPPAAPPASQDPMCRAIWDFTGQSKGEMSIKKGETVIIVRKESNGWWLARPTGSSPHDTTVQGWVPSAYVEEIAVQAAPPPPPPVSRPVPAAPAAANGMNGGGGRPVPPAKRPVARKPATAGGAQDAARDSMAGGLAEALRQRQAALNSRRNDGGGW